MQQELCRANHYKQSLAVAESMFHLNYENANNTEIVDDLCESLRRAQCGWLHSRAG